MLNVGVIASSGQLNNLPKAGGQTYTGSSNYVTPVFTPSAPQAPVVSNLTIGVAFGVGNVATWDPFVNPPGTIYNITTYNADGSIFESGQQSLYGNVSYGLAGFVSVPTGGTATVQAVVDVNNVTTYSDPVVPTSPTLQQLGVGGTHA